MQTNLVNFVEHLHSNNFSKNTIMSYERDIEEFIIFLKNKKIMNYRKVKEHDISCFLDELKERGRANATISRKSTSIKKFFNHMHLVKKIDFNPCENINRPRIERVKCEEINKSDIKKMQMLIYKTSFIGVRDYAILQLLFDTGIKASELVNLNIKDFDTDLKQIKIKNENGRESRLILLKNTSYIELFNYTKNFRKKNSKKNSKALFLNYSGDRISRQSVWKMVKKYAEKASIEKDVTLNTIRNSFAANLLESGTDPSKVQKIMGYNSKNSMKILTK